MASSLSRTAVMVLIVLLGQTVNFQVRAVAPIAQFIFGDSLVDQGNNNYLSSIAKANFKPNGIDLTEFNNQPTGRFCNGKLVSDFISDYMGTPSVLAYLDPSNTGQNLLRGANYASAGSGILDDTGAIFVKICLHPVSVLGAVNFLDSYALPKFASSPNGGLSTGSAAGYSIAAPVQRLSLNQQIAYFQDTKATLEGQIGQAASDLLISKALFAFTTGGNDFINNYLLPASPRAAQYPNVQDFTSLVINNFEQQLKQIYSYGARKISIANIGPIGCIPDKLQSNSVDGSCVDSINQIAIGFNALLKPMIDNLAPQLPGSIITYSDSYTLVLQMINNPATYGFTSTNVACCGTGRFNGLIPCTAITSLCPDREHYLFWDPFHPSERANSIVVNLLINGPTSVITPMNLAQLIPL